MNPSSNDLRTYLSDHYAGGVGAIELLEHLSKIHQDDRWSKFFRELLSDVKSDHEILRRLITDLGFDDSSVRNAGAWIVEKVGRIKIGFGAGTNGGLRDFEALETLFIGIIGKRLLWRALGKVNRTWPFNGNLDFAQLERRATDQLERVEAERLQLAETTFSG